jgi:hypothetical protein
MTNRLLVNPGTPQAWEIQLKSGQNRLGRADQNDFQVNHPSVSGTHCEILVSSAGVLLKDLGSTNGTYVNRAPVHEALLQTGQHVHLGGVEMLFEATRPATAPAPMATSVATPVAARINLPRPAASGPRITKPPAEEPPPAEVESPPMAPPLAPPVAPIAVGQAFCKFHQNSPAGFFCNHCQKYFCNLCVTTREVGGLAGRFCRTCGAECVPVQVNVARGAGKKGFYARLPGAFIYPFRGAGVLILVCATIAFSALSFISGELFGICAAVGFYGLLFLFMQNIIHTTASDENEAPGFPRVGDLGGAAFQLGATILSSFGPAIGLAAARFFKVEIPGEAIIAAVIFGCFYFPMAFLAVAMKDSVLAANPLVVVPAILKIPWEYLVTCILLMSVFGLRKLGDMTSGVAKGVSLHTRDMSVPFIALGVQAAWAFASIYLLAVSMRILGLLYITKKEKLGFSR